MTTIEKILREAGEEDLQLGDDHDCTKGMSFLRQALREVVEEVENINFEKIDDSVAEEYPIYANGWSDHTNMLSAYIKNLKEELKK